MPRPLKYKLLITIFVLLTAFVCNHHFQICALNHFNTSTEKTLRMMTWNIHVTDPAFKEKQTDIANEIIKQDADIVLINEFYLDAAAQLHSQLQENYPYVAESYGKVLGGDILYSRYPIESCKCIETPITHPVAYEFRIKVAENLIRIVGCHLSSNNYDRVGRRYIPKLKNRLLDLPNYYANYREIQKIRTQQTEQIRDCILEQDLPTIVMGDMNDFSGTKPLNTLQSIGFKDAWWEGGVGFGITFREKWMRFRLDHILYDLNWKLSSIKVVQIELSDHLPIVGEFTFVGSNII